MDQTTTLIGLIDRISSISLSSVSNNDESEVEICDISDYFIGKADMKCKDKLVSDHFKTVILTEYRELFSGIGKHDGEIKMILKSNVVPYVAPMRRVALSLQEPLKKELDRLVQQGVIVQLGIDEPREWCNSFVCVQKPNCKIRLCLDPTQLNNYIVCPHKNAKLVEDLLPKLSGVKIFSTVDACSSFFMMTLSKESSYLTTFATMFGRY